MSVVETNASSCVGTAVNRAVTINALPSTSAISGLNSVCASSTGVAYSVTNTAGSTYAWTITGGTQASGTTTNSITVNWGAAGAGNVSVVETNAAACSGAAVNYVVTKVANLTWYQDLDGDGYGSAVTQLSCNNLAPAYSLVGGDCNDASAAIHSGATEICYNNIDDNCDGNKSEGCAAVIVNMTPSFNNTTLSSVSTTMTAVPYFYTGATSIGYRFWIENMTTLEVREINSATRFVQIPSDIAAYSTQYQLKVSAIINGEIVAYAGSTITVTTPGIPTTQLSSAYCNTTLAGINATISANPGLNATSYTFRIRKTSDNPTLPALPNYGYTNAQASRYVSSSSFIGFALEFGTSYTVTVKYTSLNNGVTVESAYGSECTITTPSIPVVGLVSPICGTRLASISTTISASPASSPVHYMFRLRLTSDTSLTPAYSTILSTSRFAQLPSLTGPVALTYDTSYSISVRYSVMYNGSEVYSSYGSECEVVTPFASTSELQPSQCGTAADDQSPAVPYAVPSMTTPIYAVAVSGVSYIFQLQKYVDGNPVGSPLEITRVLNWFTLNLVTGITAGEYTVTVITHTPYGDGYGKDCTITVPAPARETADDVSNVKVTFSAAAYPNPFANNFVIDVKTRSESAVTLKVYDMIGRLVDQREVKVSDLESSPIGDNYPSGVYNVIVTQGDEVRTVRVVKR